MSTWIVYFVFKGLVIFFPRETQRFSQQQQRGRVSILISPSTVLHPMMPFHQIFPHWREISFIKYIFLYHRNLSQSEGIIHCWRKSFLKEDLTEGRIQPSINKETDSVLGWSQIQWLAHSKAPAANNGSRPCLALPSPPLP